jgi:hypothetical protein
LTLGELREYIRVQLDMDSEELPDALLDTWLSEGFLRTISMETRWPFYETRWDVGIVDPDLTIILPPDCDPTGIVSLVDSGNGYRLMQIGVELAEDNFIGAAATASNPAYYSIYGNEVSLWPTLPTGSEARSFRLRGYRYPRDWIVDGDVGVPDCDVRLHMLLAYYAIALAYAQQEDEVLEGTYMHRWQSSYLAAHSAIMAPRHHRPLIFNGGIPYRPGYNPVIWGPPVGP